jgi:hypothetical protein
MCKDDILFSSMLFSFLSGRLSPCCNSLHCLIALYLFCCLVLTKFISFTNLPFSFVVGPHKPAIIQIRRCTRGCEQGVKFNRITAQTDQLWAELLATARLVYILYFMYRRPILCTLYGAVDYLNVLKKYIMHRSVPLCTLQFAVDF